MTGLVTSHDKRLDQDGEENKIQQKEDAQNEKSELVGRTQVGHQGYFKGWRSGVFLGAISAATMFLINLITTIWALAHAGNGLSGTLALYSGSCTRTHKLNVGIHLLLNIFSTILLSGSNYCTTLHALALADRQISNAYLHPLAKKSIKPTQRTAGLTLAYLVSGTLKVLARNESFYGVVCTFRPSLCVCCK